MFSPMYLMIEKNKLKERFKGTVASAIIEDNPFNAMFIHNNYLKNERNDRRDGIPVFADLRRMICLKISNWLKEK